MELDELKKQSEYCEKVDMWSHLVPFLSFVFFFALFLQSLIAMYFDSFFSLVFALDIIILNIIKKSIRSINITVAYILILPFLSRGYMFLMVMN